MNKPLVVGVLVIVAAAISFTFYRSKSPSQDKIVQENLNTPSAATIDSLPFSNSIVIHDKDRAISFSEFLLILKGYSIGHSYEAADYATITFPNGDYGVFVTFGFGGPTGGIKLLYRYKEIGGPFSLLSSESKPLGAVGCEYGYDALNYKRQPIEVVKPFLHDQNKIFLKVSCTSHAGTGLYTNYMELLDFDDQGEKIVFEGINYNFPTESYDYSFKDLDQDGVQELIQSGTFCHNQILIEGTSKVKPIDCEKITKTYTFNGDTFKETYLTK